MLPAHTKDQFLRFDLQAVTLDVPMKYEYYVHPCTVSLWTKVAFLEEKDSGKPEMSPPGIFLRTHQTKIPGPRAEPPQLH